MKKKGISSRESNNDSLSDSVIDLTHVLQMISYLPVIKVILRVQCAICDSVAQLSDEAQRCPQFCFTLGTN